MEWAWIVWWRDASPREDLRVRFGRAQDLVESYPSRAQGCNAVGLGDGQLAIIRRTDRGTSFPRASGGDPVSFGGIAGHRIPARNLRG